MTKSQLIEALAARQKLLRKEAELIVNTIFDKTCETLLRGERIELRGFGSFKVKHYPSYMGRNPRTGEQTQVKEKRLPFFKGGKTLKKRVDQIGQKSGPA